MAESRISLKQLNDALAEAIERRHKQQEREQRCAAIGHPGEEVLSIFTCDYNPLQAQCHCYVCNSYYVRKTTPKESHDFQN